MKFTLSTLTLMLLLSFNGKAQVTVTFDDSTQKDMGYTSDPTRLPKWEVKLNPFCISGQPITMFGYNIHPVYRMNSDWSAELEFNTAYGSATNENSDNSEIGGPTLNMFATGHRKLVEFERSKVKSVTLDYQYEGDVTKLYKVNVPRTTLFSLRGDAGFFLLKTNSSFSDSETGDNSTSFKGGNITDFGIQIGASLQIAKSELRIADDTKRSYYRYGNLYFHTLTSVASAYKTYEETVISPTTTDGEYTYTYVENDAGLSELNLKRFGWRFGYDYNLGFKNSGNALIFGFSGGRIPTFIDSNNLDHKSGQEGGKSYGRGFLMIKFGMSFGANPWKDAM